MVRFSLNSLQDTNIWCVDIVIIFCTVLITVVLRYYLFEGRSEGSVFMSIFDNFLVLWWGLCGLESPLRLFGTPGCFSSLWSWSFSLSVKSGKGEKGVLPYCGECLLTGFGSPRLHSPPLTLTCNLGEVRVWCPW